MLTNTLGFALRNGFGPGRAIGGGWMFLAMGVRMLIFICLIILAVRLFKKHSNKNNDALKILNEKFALGEITEEEYLKKRTILTQK